MKKRVLMTLLFAIVIASLGLSQASGKEVELEEFEEGLAPEMEPTEVEVNVLLDTFYESIIAPTNGTNEVLAYKDKQSLIESFAHLASENVAKMYVDELYFEKNDKLYLIPTEMPPWFHENRGYDMVKLDDHTIEITQANFTDYYGRYTVQARIVFDGDWRIDQVIYK